MAERNGKKTFLINRLTAYWWRKKNNRSAHGKVKPMTLSELFAKPMPFRISGQEFKKAFAGDNKALKIALDRGPLGDDDEIEISDASSADKKLTRITIFFKPDDHATASTSTNASLKR